MCWISGYNKRDGPWKYLNLVLYPLSSPAPCDLSGFGPKIKCEECPNPPAFRCQWILPSVDGKYHPKQKTRTPKLYDHLCFDCLSKNVGWIPLEMWIRRVLGEHTRTSS